ncbi:MAG: hypothetical protein WBD47_10980, partial [Phormidesmis sp.]
HRDANGPFSEAMTQELVQRCQDLNLTYGFKDDYITAKNQTRSKPYPLGRTELGRIVVATDGAISGTTLQIPTTEYHTATETASLSAITAMIQLLTSYL